MTLNIRNFKYKNMLEQLKTEIEEVVLAFFKYVVYDNKPYLSDIVKQKVISLLPYIQTEENIAIYDGLFVIDILELEAITEEIINKKELQDKFKDYYSNKDTTKCLLPEEIISLFKEEASLLTILDKHITDSEALKGLSLFLEKKYSFINIVYNIRSEEMLIKHYSEYFIVNTNTIKDYVKNCYKKVDAINPIAIDLYYDLNKKASFKYLIYSFCHKANITLIDDRFMVTEDNTLLTYRLLTETVARYSLCDYFESYLSRYLEDIALLLIIKTNYNSFDLYTRNISVEVSTMLLNIICQYCFLNESYEGINKKYFLFYVINKIRLSIINALQFVCNKNNFNIDNFGIVEKQKEGFLVNLLPRELLLEILIKIKNLIIVKDDIISSEVVFYMGEKDFFHIVELLNADNKLDVYVYNIYDIKIMEIVYKGNSYFLDDKALLKCLDNNFIVEQLVKSNKYEDINLDKHTPGVRRVIEYIIEFKTVISSNHIKAVCDAFNVFIEHKLNKDKVENLSIELWEDSLIIYDENEDPVFFSIDILFNKEVLEEKEKTFNLSNN